MDASAMDNQEKKITGVPVALVSILALPAGILRLFPSFGILAMNFNPIGGLAIFCGARCRSWAAFVIPLAVMIATDLVLAAFLGEQYSPLHESQAIVYFCFLIYVLIGRAVANTTNPFLLVSASVLGSLQFFLLTNFVSWMQLTWLYSRDLAGLMECYVKAIPFSQGTFIGDLVFTGVFFCGYALWPMIEKKLKPEVAG
jgi:hypothetical protein